MIALAPLLAFALTVGATDDRPAAPPAAGPFATRGYYITFMRMPTYDLDDWKRIVDGIADDGGNTLLLWVAGAFRSEAFPITWAYNREHENIRRDFVRDLIDHAHARGVRVLLGFTPFGYDGVNQVPIEHPELRATGPDGKPAARFGIGCWGVNLCPSKPDSQAFMLDYVREMFFTFYPNADGLLIESSDYAACRCADCGTSPYDAEFAFVRRISDEVWARKPDATIVVYPHYFSGADVPGLGVKGARRPFDPRWTLFFTPHSAPITPDLARRAAGALWWDDSPALRGPAQVQAGARRARDAGLTGYVPSLEAYTFLATEAEEGQEWLKGRRQVPLGFGWLAPGDPPYDALPMRINRIAYREFSRDPDLAWEAFRAILARELFGPSSRAGAVDDALALQAVFAADRTWCQPAPLTAPDRVRAMRDRGELTPGRRAALAADLDRVRALAARTGPETDGGEAELRRIARWIADRWTGDAAALLAEPDAAPVP